MDDDFDQSIFTLYFNFTIFLGFWVIESDNRVKKFLYLIYSAAMHAWVLFMASLGLIDLLEAIPEIRRVFFNICINLLLMGIWIKTVLICLTSNRINCLRKSLHRNFKICKDETEVLIYNDAVGDITFITRVFYLFLVTFFPVWLGRSLCSGYWGERELPLPAKWPFSFDINDSKSFILICLFYGLFALFYLFQALAIEVSMFGLLTQINREFRFLVKRIEEFGNFCDDLYSDYDKNFGQNDKLGEVNIFLQKAKARRLLKEIITRQTQLFAYTKDFQFSYRVPMFIQMFAGGFLVTVNGIQTMTVSFQFDVRMSYQLGYVIILLLDILYLCWLSNKISTESFEVGTAFYATPWYKMDVDFQKDILFVIHRSRIPARITSGSFLELNLNTYMQFLKHIYGWLALYRQMEFK